MKLRSAGLLVRLLLALGLSAQAMETQCGGYGWAVRSGRGGPGLNAWDESNVWLFKGLAPKDGQEVKVIICDFRFTPE